MNHTAGKMEDCEKEIEKKVVVVLRGSRNSEETTPRS